MSHEGPKNIRANKAETAETPKSLGEQETLSYLRENGAEPLALEDFTPHEPVLYVMRDWVRGLGHFHKLPPGNVPSFVRVDDPLALDRTKISIGDEGTAAEGVTIYPLESKDRVDYYALDAKTGTPRLVMTTSHARTGSNSYFVEEGYLFRAGELFKPSES